ncbi:hypothetical protein BS17DRAFT_775514 [Gyrodon lividus]|nr:hypothetical protein BS17DRAFT_775514 [Gyrodon lividus]
MSFIIRRLLPLYLCSLEGRGLGLRFAAVTDSISCTANRCDTPCLVLLSFLLARFWFDGDNGGVMYLSKPYLHGLLPQFKCVGIFFANSRWPLLNVSSSLRKHALLPALLHPLL